MLQVKQQSDFHSSNNSVTRINSNFSENKISTLYDEKLDPFIEFFKWIYYTTNFNDFQQVYHKLIELNDLTFNYLSNSQIYIHERLLDQVQDYVATYKDFVHKIFTKFIPELESFRNDGTLWCHHSDITDHIKSTYTIENITSTQYQVIPSLQQIWIKRIQKIKAMYKLAESKNYSSKYISNDDFYNVIDQISGTIKHFGNEAIQIADAGIRTLTNESHSNENDYEKGTWRVNNGSGSVKALTNGSANESTDESADEFGDELYENKSGNRQQMWENAKKNSNSKKGKKNKNYIKGQASVNSDEVESTPINASGCFSNSNPKEKHWSLWESIVGKKKKKRPVLLDDETSYGADDESKSFGIDTGSRYLDERIEYEKKRDEEDKLILSTKEHFHNKNDKKKKEEIRKIKKKLRERKLNTLATKIKRTYKEYIEKKKAAADLAEKECLEKLDEANKLNLKELSHPYNLKFIGINAKIGKIKNLEISEYEEKKIDEVKNEFANAKPVRTYKNGNHVSSDDDCDDDADTVKYDELDELEGSTLKKIDLVDFFDTVKYDELDELEGSTLTEID